MVVFTFFLVSLSVCHSPQVPVLQNNNGPPLVGLVTVACHLVKQAQRPELLGDSPENRAVVQQWLEYRVSKLDGFTKEDVKTILKVDNGRLISEVESAHVHSQVL